MLIKIVDNMDSPWALGVYGELMVNSENLNDFEEAYDAALAEFYALAYHEKKLFDGAHPSLVAAYKHAKNDLPIPELPKIIEIFELIKQNWGTDPGDQTELPDREDLIEGVR